MAKLTLLKRVPASTVNLAHRTSVNEGEAARRLLESQGYRVKKARKELTCPCPFHEGPGEVQRSKTPNFYLNAETSKYYCQSASCGERGNLRTLERFFGLHVDSDGDSYVAEFQSREVTLQQFESALISTSLREVFYRQGLSDTTIERFRIGYDPIKERYVIPYLEGRRPRFFRYYQPLGDPRWKYTWEEGAESTLFNAQDGQGDKDGIVFLCEGELKAMLLVQMGYAAVAVPGAGQWKPEWHESFTNARSIMVCFDNDNPEFHIYDRPEKGQRCNKCQSGGLDSCVGHNPGQEAAEKRVHQLGWRAKNVLLPLPSAAARKTDVNEYFMRDGHTNADFAELATGKRATPFKVMSLAEISESPPEEAVFLVSEGILSRGGRLLVSGRPKVGKMAGISTPVLTPTGWVTMGDIDPGDQVVGVDGEPVEVVQIHPQGVKPLYRVTLSDGSSTNCGAEHLWTIQTHHDREASKRDGRPRWRTMDTLAVRKLLSEGHKRAAYLPVVAPVQYAPNGPLPLEPYGLGLMLGDGSMTGTTPTFCKPELELHEALAKSFPANRQHVLDAERGSISLAAVAGANELTQGLRNMGLWGCRSWEKFIPEAYLRAPVEDRLAILHGLCDTDGWVQRNSRGNTGAYFGTSSERLKDHFVELVESLGGVTRVRCKSNPKHQSGTGRPAWSVRFKLPQGMKPFRLSRKLDAWQIGQSEKNAPPTRRIVSIEYSHDEEAKCITVANKDGLYVTERFIVTHNSLFINNLVLSLAAGIPFLKSGNFEGFKVDHPTRTLLLDRELSKHSLFKRMTELVESRPGYRAATENLLIDHDHLIRLDSPTSYDTLLQLIEHNGAEVIVMDTAYKFFGGDIESSKSIMKGFEVLDRLIHETGVAVVLTHHHRKSQQARGKENTDVADPDSVAGSFLWTGWPNASILLNFLQRSVENPFNSVATFAAFRDAAPPEPVALYRSRESISYTSVERHTHSEAGHDSPREVIRPTTEAVEALLLDACPITEENFAHAAAAHFGVSIPTVKPYLVEALSRGNFERKGRPAVIRFKYEEEPETWEAEHGFAPKVGSDDEARVLPMFGE